LLPCLLSQEQKNRTNKSAGFQQRLERNPKFLSKIIMWYEPWVYGFDQDTQQVFSLEEPTISTGGRKKGWGGGNKFPLV
jgi:hypothetical protein